MQKQQNVTMVENRNGDLAPLDFKKIQAKTEPAVEGLVNVSSSDLELDANLQIFSGMKTSAIQQTLIRTAVDKIDVDAPDWTFVAARLTLEDLYHEVGMLVGEEKGQDYPHLKRYLDYGSEFSNINKTFWKKYSEEDLEYLNDLIQSNYKERDYQFNYLGLKTFMDRYLMRNKEGKVFELPQQAMMAVAMFIAQNEKDKRGWAEKFYDILSKFEVMTATPTTSNARTNRNQLSSCFAGVTADNIEDIFSVYKDMALLSKFGGGIGWDWHNVRAGSSQIDDHKGVGGGTVPFLKIANDVAIAVDQLGTRKGAIAVYIEPWHMDVRDFLDLKKNSGEERRRAHDLFPALWIPDLFMKRAKEEGLNWTLFDPYEVPELHELYGEAFEKAYIEAEKRTDIRKELVSAKDLWKKTLISYFEVGSPFLNFKDTANTRNQNSHDGVIHSSNLCTEIFQNTSAATYAVRVDFQDGSTATYKEQEDIEYVISDTETSFKKAKKLTNIDTILTSEGKKDIYFVSKEVDKAGDVLVCNLASVNVSKVHTVRDLERVVPIAIRLLDNVIDLNFYPIKQARDTNEKTRAIGLGVMGEAQMVAEKGITWGTQEHFMKIDEVMDEFSYQVILASSNIAKEKGSYPAYEGSNWSKGIFPIDTMNEKAKSLTTYELDKVRWDALKEQVKTDGIRNGYLMAIAPTSTISIITGTTQAIEPVYKRKWFEENISGLIPVTAPNLNSNNWAHYIPAYDVDQIDLVKAGAVRQKWLDQGQSLNVFIRLDKSSGKYLNDIYTTAWEHGIKSTYYLRGQSPEQADTADTEDRSQECVGCQ